MCKHDAAKELIHPHLNVPAFMVTAERPFFTRTRALPTGRPTFVWLEIILPPFLST
jgi:hypothetical protein